MENTCSFFAITGGQCGYDRRDRSKSVKCVSLISCERDITGHKSSLAIHDVDNEIDLILARSSIYSRPRNITQMIICPAHRSSLGMGWKRDSANCRVPEMLSNHHDGKRPKADRGLSKAGSWMVLKESGIFLPVGTGALCRLYRFF